MKKMLIFTLVLSITLAGCWPQSEPITTLSPRDYTETIEIINNYQDALIVYSAIITTNTEKTDFKEWQTWISQNQAQWNRLSSLEKITQNPSQNNHNASAQANPTSQTIDNLPLELENRLLDRIKEDADKFQLQLNAYQDTNESEYSEVELTSQLANKPEPEPSVKTSFFGYNLPLPTVSNTSQWATSMAFKSYEYLTNNESTEHLRIKDTETAIHDDGENITIYSNHTSNRKFSDTAILAAKDLINKPGFLYLLKDSITRPEKLVLSSIASFANQADFENHPLVIQTDNNQVKIEIDNDNQAKIAQQHNINDILKAVYPKGSFTVGGFDINTNDTTPTTPNQADPNLFDGNYTTSFTIDSGLGVVTYTDITFTVIGNLIKAELISDSPTTNYQMGSITSYGSTSFTNTIENNQFDMQSVLTLNTTTVVGSASEQTTQNDTVTLTGTVSENEIIGIASSSLLGSTDFIALKK